MMSEMDVNAIAGTLKLYFRELPEPLFTDEFYPNFAEGIGERSGRLPPLLSSAPFLPWSVFQPELCVGQGGPKPGRPWRPLSYRYPLSLSPRVGWAGTWLSMGPRLPPSSLELLSCSPNTRS